MASVRVVMVGQVVPQGLAAMAPGPELATLLSDIDIHAVTGTDLVDVLCAQARQLAHEQARLLAILVEVELCDPDARPGEVARLVEPPPYAADEIRAALAWTRVAADRELVFAETLVLRMPPVFAALDSGRICRSKAWLFAHLCSELTAEQTDIVCDRLLPAAGRLTTGELAVRIKKLALALDPGWAERRYATAVRERRVVGYFDEDGTATIAGSGLPADQATAACARVQELANAAKRAGYPGRIDPLRADIYLGLLDGRWQHLDRDQIIADLLATANTEGGSRDVHPADSADAAPAEPAEPAEPVRSGSRPDHSDPGAGGGGGTALMPRPEWQARVGVELRVGLATLLGRDEHPGEIPAWGPVTADVARGITAAQRRAEWRFAITDPDGHLLLGGLTHRRPRPLGKPNPGAPPPTRGGIVELHVPATLLTELTNHPGTCGDWAAVITDIAGQYSHRRTITQDPTARFAGAALRRHVEIRDRSCSFIGCRCPAHRADLDHTVDHAHGGPTTDANSGPACGHDHRLKHKGGWRLHQPEPGHFVWISPLGRRYHTRPQPISIDLPPPVPGDYPPEDLPRVRHDTGEDEPIIGTPPPTPDPPPAPPPPDNDEPPPF